MTPPGSAPDLMRESGMLEEDEAAREQALDVQRSFLVKAPAGSGKTELLTRRFLALLSVVEEPEEILAITFTRAATAEMRSRVLADLQRAKESLDRGTRPGRDRLAMAALERAQARGWSLLEQPQRLNIQTIDSLCLRIAYEAPLLSQLGGQLQPVDDGRPLYAMAARRTMEQLGEQLGGSHARLSTALEHLLRLRDVNLGDCEKLIADMLQERDQWLEEFGSAHALSEEEWEQMRVRLEEPFRREQARVFDSVRNIFARHDEKFTRLLGLLAHACRDGKVPPSFRAVAAFRAADDLLELEHFDCVRNFLLTKGNTLRRQPDPAIGFRALKEGGSRERKAEFETLMKDLELVDGLLEAMCEVGGLPNRGFSDEEWRTIRSIFTVLLHAAGELRVVFAEHARIDFVEAGITAERALLDPEVQRRWSQQIRHLLVDEFQDTSRRQYALLRQIVREWDPQEARTCFLVGDPMQSIYLFRNADLALFDEAQRHGFGPEAQVRLEHLTLSRNFRSTAGMVEPVNTMFNADNQQGAEGARHFTPALANPDTEAARAMLLHPYFVAAESADEDGKTVARQAEAAEAITIIRTHLPALERARAHGDAFRVGVLVRTKQHVLRIAEALREAGIPYRAVEIESLKDTQEVRDLLALVKALQHPMDRIAWLSVLRAPWCGLDLADLHCISGSDDPALHPRTTRELLATRMQLLSEDGKLRAARVQPILDLALATRFSGEFQAAPNGFAAWIERTWTMLGGRQCVNDNEYENVQALFRLLAELTPLEAAGASIEDRLESLFAQPDPAAQERCGVQLMTIHKAKGLGFDVVLVPQMERLGGRTDTPLLQRMTRTRREGAERELLIAPIGTKGGEASATYKWISSQIERQERAELHRLLYVACTRARTELHLFASIKLKKQKGESGAGAFADPQSGSLLRCGWNYLKPLANERYLQQAAETRVGSGLQLVAHKPHSAAVLDLAAAGLSRAQTWRRLPANWTPQPAKEAGGVSAVLSSGLVNEATVQRRIGSPASRARGTVLHALFESYSLLEESDARRDLTRSMDHWRRVSTTMLQNAGLTRRDVEVELKTVLAMLQAAVDDPSARWILGKHRLARSEGAWTMRDKGSLITIRCDRVFLAGSEALSEGDDTLWIVDYKTADGSMAGSFLADEQQRYGPQLDRYARALRLALGTDRPVRLALYYPAIQRLHWWRA